jgi:4-amino-4-deoxy-L-arabinose transferase-like glycosyltransferase
LSSTTPPQSTKPATPPEPIGEQTSWPILITAMVLLIAPIVTLSQIGAHNRVDVVDDQMFGYFGWRIAHGAVVYQDVWDNKPPGIYWTNALGFLIGGDSYGGVVFLCVLAVAVSLTCFFIISASVYFRGAAAAATVLASFYLTHAFFQGATNRTETFLMTFELAGVALYFRGFARDRWWKWLLAGACCGCAFLYKQVGLAAWGTLGLHTIILVIMRDLSWRDGLRRCLLLLGGMLAAVALAIIVIVAQGAADKAYFAVFRFNRAYFASADSSLTEIFFNRYFLQQYVGTALLLPVLMAIAALIHSILWRLRPAVRPAEIESQVRTLKPVCPRFMLLFLIWYVVAFYGAAVSPHRFRHYLLPTLPPLMLMGGYLISFLRTEISLAKRLQQRVWVTACFVAMGYFALGSLIWQWEELSRVWLFRIEEGKQAEWEVVGAAAARLTEPDDRIHCQGYMPGVYLHARRLNASRYTTTEKLGQVWETEEADIIRHELREQLEAAPPALMVMSTGDYGMIREAQPPGDHPDWLGWWLKRFLSENYERALEIIECNVLIFQRKHVDAERVEPPPTAETRSD